MTAGELGDRRHDRGLDHAGRSGHPHHALHALLAALGGSYGALFYEDALAGVTDFEEIDFSAAALMPPLGPSVDLFGDGSIWAIATPGHTVGHTSYLVVAKGGPVLLTGDASHLRWGFEHGVAPGKFNDGSAEDARKSLDALRAFVRQFPGVKVVFGHSR